MISAKNFIIGYLSSIVKGTTVEAVGDITHYPKKYTFTKKAADSEPPERQGEFLPSGNIPLAKTSPSIPANKTALSYTQKSTKVQTPGQPPSREQKGLTLGDRAAILRDNLGNKRQRKQAKNYLTQAAEKTTGPKTFDRLGPTKENPNRPAAPVADPAKQHYLTTKKEFMDMGGSGKEIKHSDPVDSAHPVTKHTMKRSAKTGRSYVDTERVEVKPEMTKPSHKTSVQPETIIPTVRVDLPGRSGPHVANAVTKALIKATNSPWKKSLLARQAAVKKSDEEI